MREDRGSLNGRTEEGEEQKGIRLRGITMRSNVVNINETKVISVFLFFFLSNGLFEGEFAPRRATWLRRISSGRDGACGRGSKPMSENAWCQWDTLTRAIFLHFLCLRSPQFNYRLYSSYFFSFPYTRYSRLLFRVYLSTWKQFTLLKNIYIIDNNVWLDLT